MVKVNNLLCNTGIMKMVNFDGKFSEISLSLKGSAIRDLLKFADRPGVIAFGGGFPNPLAFPVNEIKEIIDDLLLSENGWKALQYGTTEGLNELRDMLAKRVYDKYGIKASRENIVTLNGSQSGLYMVSKTFLNKGDAVVSEAPTYAGAITAFNAQLPTWIAIDIEDDGPDMDLMEKRIKESINNGKRPKFAYVVPTFQNPAGITWSMEKRKHLLELASEYDFLIFEDDPYSEIRFDGKELKPIKSMDTEDRVIYMGTFSKVLAPGIRLGFIVAHEEIKKRIVLLKQAVDLATNTLSQYMALEYLKRGLIDKQVPKIVEIYRKKRNIMLESLENYMPEGTKWTRPEGGMFLWVTMDKKIDTTKMLEDALKENVAYVVGTGFYPDGRGKNSMRLNFTYPSDEEIVEGIKRLGKVAKSYLS